MWGICSFSWTGHALLTVMTMEYLLVMVSALCVASAPPLRRLMFTAWEHLLLSVTSVRSRLLLSTSQIQISSVALVTPLKYLSILCTVLSAQSAQ